MNITKPSNGVIAIHIAIDEITPLSSIPQRPHLASTLYKLGPAFTFYNNLLVDSVTRAIDLNLNKLGHELLRKIQEYYVIVVIDDLVKDLTEDEYEAMLQHELAHIQLGHIKRGLGHTSTRTRIALEVAADRQAADKTSVEIVLSMLHKLERSLSNCGVDSFHISERVKFLKDLASF